jgi:hypothetical protein
MWSARYYCAIVRKRELSKQIFEKKTQISNFINIRPVSAELFHADRRTDRRTDMTKLIVAYRNFAKAPNDYLILSKFVFIFKLHNIFKIVHTLYVTITKIYITTNSYTKLEQNMYKTSQEFRHVSVYCYTIFRGTHWTHKSTQIQLIKLLKTPLSDAVLWNSKVFSVFPWRWCNNAPKHVVILVKFYTHLVSILCTSWW